MINASFPALRAFARELTPSVKELPGTIRAGTPWLRQADKLVQRNELGGIVDDLHAATPVLSQGTANLSGLLLQLGRFSRCVTGPHPDRQQRHQRRVRDRPAELPRVPLRRPGRPGEGANFDGNGQFLRVQPGGGPVRGRAPNPRWRASRTRQRQLRARDRAPHRHPAAEAFEEPPVRTDVPCFKQDPPNLNGPQAAVGAPGRAHYAVPGTMKKALRTYTRDFIAIIVLGVIGLLALFVILSQQSTALPAWFPILGEDRFELKTEFQTAQAITPGQGQTVNLSGVEIGDVDRRRPRERRRGRDDAGRSGVRPAHPLRTPRRSCARAPACRT